ncbi:MAG: hypothetical protein QME66_12080 [Candidatus Eisenbacteria bacterium]|nr:hypothetical protein [Candidatus Eisenbacteria bacterium]
MKEAFVVVVMMVMFLPVVANSTPVSCQQAYDHYFLQWGLNAQCLHDLFWDFVADIGLENYFNQYN